MKIKEEIHSIEMVSNQQIKCLEKEIEQIKAARNEAIEVLRAKCGHPEVGDWCTECGEFLG